MTEFTDFRKVHEAHLDDIFGSNNHLFVTDVDKDLMWEMYLDSFPEGSNQIFRERREYDCSCCRQFVKKFGNVVAIEDGKLVSIWSFFGEGIFQSVTAVMHELVTSAPVRDVHVTKENHVGVDRNVEVTEEGAYYWNHLYTKLPSRFVDTSNRSVPEIMGEHRTDREVFQRSLEEITPDALETVLDLIAEKLLYRGDEWLGALRTFKALYDEYHTLTTESKELFTWAKSVQHSGAITRIKNHSIGVLLNDLSDGMEIEPALDRYGSVYDNYQRPKAVYTTKTLEKLKATITELGYMPSLARRFAEIGDLSIRDVIWANRDAKSFMGGIGGVFDQMLQELPVDPKQYKNVQAVGIEDFIDSVLPNSSELEVLVETRHLPNLTSLIAPVDADAPSMFKWDNPFSWAYSGNVTDASMRDRVKAAGGSVDGVLRFSLQWNMEGNNNIDFDAHCREPNGTRIFFENARTVHQSSGVLDVDIINPSGKVAVENITYSNLRRMPRGEYVMLVHNYSTRRSNAGFQAEIEFGGVIHEFIYEDTLRGKEYVQVARIYFDGESIQFVESLPSSTSSREVWGLTTNQFYPVSLVCYSPNYWLGESVGNKHFMFMLPDAVSDEEPNPFFNEYLVQELRPLRRALEALGRKLKIESVPEQLSGLGFSSTKRNSVIVKVDDNLFKIVF